MQSIQFKTSDKLQKGHFLNKLEIILKIRQPEIVFKIKENHKKDIFKI